jgi:hypothetical protein
MIIPSPNDVIFGRGYKIVNRPGNQRYHKLIESMKAEHDAAPHCLKSSYAFQVARVIHSLSPRGRFLRKDKGSGNDWKEEEMGEVVKKIRQAFRDMNKLSNKNRSLKRRSSRKKKPAQIIDEIVLPPAEGTLQEPAAPGDDTCSSDEQQEETSSPVLASPHLVLGSTQEEVPVALIDMHCDPPLEIMVNTIVHNNEDAWSPLFLFSSNPKQQYDDECDEDKKDGMMADGTHHFNHTKNDQLAAPASDTSNSPIFSNTTADSSISPGRSSAIRSYDCNVVGASSDSSDATTEEASSLPFSSSSCIPSARFVKGNAGMNANAGDIMQVEGQSSIALSPRKVSYGSDEICFGRDRRSSTISMESIYWEMRNS